MHQTKGITELGQRMETQPSQHLSAEQILELVEHGKRHQHHSAYIEHIVSCAVCRETYKQLMETEQLVRQACAPQRVAVGVWLWRGAVAVAAALLLFALFTTLRPAPSWQVALHTVDGVAYEGSTRLPDWLQEARAMYESPPSTTRSALPTAVSIALTTPDPANEGLETDTPVFEWRPISESSRIFALLEPISGEGSPIPLTVEGNRAFLPEGSRLQEGVRYRLRLSAQPTSDILADEGTATYEFRVLTQEERTQLDWARQNASRAPYASALTFYQLGCYREALKGLRSQPKDPTTEQWIRAIAEQIQLRGGVP